MLCCTVWSTLRFRGWSLYGIVICSGNGYGGPCSIYQPVCVNTTCAQHEPEQISGYLREYLLCLDMFEAGSFHSGNTSV